MLRWSILFSLIAVVALQNTEALTIGKAWSSCEGYTPVPGHHHRPFEIGCWETEDGRHFVGRFTYTSRRYPDDPPVARLHGKSRRDWFWPNVSFQVSRNWSGPWKTVGHSVQGHDTLVIEAKKGYALVATELDAFKPWLGKLKCGRIVVESGEAATLDIDNLLPPEKRPKPGG